MYGCYRQLKIVARKKFWEGTKNFALIVVSTNQKIFFAAMSQMNLLLSNRKQWNSMLQIREEVLSLYAFHTKVTFRSKRYHFLNITETHNRSFFQKLQMNTHTQKPTYACPYNTIDVVHIYCMWRYKNTPKNTTM